MNSPQPPSSTGNSSRVRGRPARLALKELRETLRDRRTLITLILMPLLVYPLLGVILQKALLATITKPNEIRYGIWFCSTEEANRFKSLYHKGDVELPEGTFRPDLEIYVSKSDCDKERPEEMVAAGATDLAVRFHAPRVETGGEKRDAPAVELIYQQDSRDSQAVALMVQQRLGLVLNPDRVRLREGFSVVRREPAKLLLTPVKQSSAKVAGFSLATFVPLMLILMTVTGAVYPAIDLTAGERERGTLEVLVAAPVPRMELLAAKFVAVLSVAMLTAIVNLAAMLVTIYASGLETLIFGVGGISWLVMGQILALLLLFAAFFSAVLLAVTSFAKSFKEAQAYLIPLMLVSLAPGIFALTPGLQMNGLIAVAPLVNIVLLGRDLLQGRMLPEFLAAAVVSTVLYAFFALLLAARVFGSDAILYGSQGSLKDFLKRPEQPSAVPSLTQIIFALAVLFPGFVLLGGLPSRFPDLPMQSRLELNAVITLVLFVGWPLVMIWRNSVSFTSAFRTRLPAPWPFAVALLWGISLWVWAYELEMATLTDVRLDVIRELFESIKRDLDRVPLGWRLAMLAIVPAACEEWFFRGYLLSGLKARMSAVEAVIVSAALFGLFHVIVRDVLFFERFLPSGMMGLMLGWLAIRSGSVWPGMLLHVMHNGLLLTLEARKETIMEWGILTEYQKHLPWPWLLGSAFLIGVGIFLLMRIEDPQADQSEESDAVASP